MTSSKPRLNLTLKETLLQGGSEVRRSLDSMMGAALTYDHNEGPRLVRSWTTSWHFEHKCTAILFTSNHLLNTSGLY